MIYPPRKMSAGERLTAANYNALLDYIRRITPVAGTNVTVDYRLGGAVISGKPGGGQAEGSGVKPFTVRRHEDAWEIYLPDGCVNVGGTCAPINPPATTGGTDHDDDDPAWRVLGIDETAGTTDTDADGNSYREWDVEIHVKPSAKMWQEDGLNAPARRLVWACASDRLKPAGSVTDAERYANTPGDSWSCVVARVRVTTVSTDDGTESSRTVTQLRKTPVDVADDGQALQGFGLVWYFSVTGGALVVERVYCLRQLVSVAGISATGDTMTDVTDATWIYAKIDAADMTNVAGIVEVVSDPGNAVYSSAGTVVWLALFRMKENTVTEDHRENSLKNVQLYRA